MTENNIKKIVSNNCEICAFRNPKPTVTGVIINSDRKVLLSKRTIEPFAGWWDLVGGYMSEKETPEEALRREIKEELGVGCKSLKLLDFFPGEASYKQYKYPVISICYLVELDSENFNLDTSEIGEARWFSAAELPQIAFDSNVKIIEYVKTRGII